MEVCYQNFAKCQYDTPVKQSISKKRVTRPRLTKYEYVRVLCVRIQQLAGGAKPMIKNAKGLTDKNIAKQEIMSKSCPLIITRQLPSGDTEDWEVRELHIGTKLRENI